MQQRGVVLPPEMGQDTVKETYRPLQVRENTSVLLASIIACRVAERFRLVYEALDPVELKTFCHNLRASEAKHANIFIKMTLNYFEEEETYKRLDKLNSIEAEVLLSLPLQPALH